MSGNLDKVSAKILVLGDSGVGKSSLIHLICHSTAFGSSQWTIGCSIDVKLHGDCYLEFWDIGGSRSHKIARSFLYQDYHGIILVFDATNKKSRLNLNEWLIEVTRKTNDRDLDCNVNINVPTITIATKKDLLPYSSILELSENKSRKIDKHCSVVSFSDNSRQSPLTQNQNYLYRRQLAANNSSSASSSPSAMMSSSTNPFASFHSQSQLSSPLLPPPQQQQHHHRTSRMQPAIEPLLENQVIYVNTQDVLSITPGSSNHDDLNNFFKQVIDRRNRFYNKFSI